MRTVNRMSGVFICLIGFILMVWYCYVSFAYNYPYIEQMDIFLFNKEYAVENIFQIGGLSSYVASFIIQFFIHPLNGAIAASLIFFLSAAGMYGVWKKVSSFPPVMFLCFLPSIALLWVQHDFYFRWGGCISLLLSLLLLNIYVRIRSLKPRFVFSLLCVTVGYYLSGPMIFVYVVGSVIYELLITGKSSYLYASIVLLAGFLFPYMLYIYGGVYELRDAYTIDFYYNSRLSPQLYHYAAPAFCLLGIIIASLLAKQKLSIKPRTKYIISFVQLVFIVVVMYGSNNKYNPSNNYEAKVLDYYCRMERWNDILGYDNLRASKNLIHTCYQNLALSKTGQLGEGLFKYPQTGARGLVIGWNKQIISSALLSDVFYEMGNIALSQEMAFEAMVSTDKAMSARFLMRLVQTNIIFGNYKVAEKYIRKLEDTWMYSDEAGSYRKFLYNDALVSEDPVLGAKRRCIENASAIVTSSMYNIGLYNAMRNSGGYRPALEYYGALCLLSKDMEAFKVLPDIYFESNLVMPTYFQEAFIVLYEGDAELWNKYNISQSVIDRYGAFKACILSARKSRSNPAYLAKANFGNTFWYYYMFKK